MKFKILEDNVDLTKLIDTLKKNKSDWNNISIPGTSGLTEITSCIPLALAVKKDNEDIDDSEMLRKTFFYEKYHEFGKFAASRGFANHSRMGIFKLEPGEMNATHNEEGVYYNKRHRYHLAISGEYDLTVDGETHRIKPGMFFWFNNKLQHSALNIGNDTRYSFVFDVLTTIPYSYNETKHEI